MIDDILDCTRTTLYPIPGESQGLGSHYLRMGIAAFRIDGITEHKKI
jgi:hypothetical protein